MEALEPPRLPTHCRLESIGLADVFENHLEGNLHGRELARWGRLPRALNCEEPIDLRRSSVHGMRRAPDIYFAFQEALRRRLSSQRRACLP